MSTHVWVAKINKKSTFFSETGESLTTFMSKVIYKISNDKEYDNKYLIEIYKYGEEDKLYK